MFRRKYLRVPICILLALLMLVDHAIFAPAPALALDKKSVLVGAGIGVAAGAGIVLAAPMVGTAIAAAGGIAGIGTAIVGGLAAAGGAVIGVLGAVGGAIAAGVGAIGGWIVGIICSPLFIPALIIIAAVAIGYYLYRKHKKAQTNTNVIPGGEEIVISPGDYDMNPVIPPKNPNAPISVNDTISIPGGGVVSIGDTVPIVTVPTAPVAAVDPVVTTPTTVVAPADLATAEARYKAAYTKYISLMSTGGSGNVQTALSEYRTAYNEFMTLKRMSTGQK